VPLVHSTDDLAQEIATPGHLRRFLGDTSDLLLVPGSEPYPEHTATVDPVPAD
jgi:hypothetical protein